MKRNSIIIIISSVVLLFTVGKFGLLFISIPSFIALSYFLSDFILKITNKKDNNKKELGKNFQFIFFIGLIPSLFLIRNFENTIGGYNLFWKLAFLSLAFTVLTTLILSRYFEFSWESKRSNILSICICYFLLIPNIGIFINTYVLKGDERKQITIINYKEISQHAKGGNSYNIFLTTKYDTNERLDIEKELYESIKEDNSITLTLRKGILGYDYVEKIDVN